MLQTLLVLLFVTIRGGLSLDCIQIQDSQIFNGSRIFIPGGTGDLQPIPARFDCTYKIKAPVNATSGFSASVVLKNGLRGVNDIIYVTKIDGTQVIMNNRTGTGPYTYSVIPGTEMSVRVFTKSVLMDSKFSIFVEYRAAKIGPIIEMKTNGEMNYIDVNTMKEEGYLYGTVTFIGTEPIYWELASAEDNSIVDCDGCYIIDGTISNMTSIKTVLEVMGREVRPTTSNAITFMTCMDRFFGVVLNPKSEWKPWISATAVEIWGTWIGMHNMFPGSTPTQEVANFESTGIIMDKIMIKSATCKAHAISGPPNNSSVLLFDLTNVTIPYRFEQNYFSMVNVDCEFEVHLKTFNSSPSVL